MLRFENVSFRYAEDDFSMMEHLNFQVEEGEFATIIGASGCGKSTIFRLINGLEKLQQGRILVDERPVQELKNYSAFMPQKDLLFPWRTIEKNICLPMELAKVPKAEQETKCREVLEQVGLSAYAKKYPKDLSGGMKQRVAFARTLLSGADLLLLDEPFSALDYLTRVDMQEWLLHQWEHYHKTILFITHDVEEAVFLSKTIFIIQDRPFSKMERVEVPLSYPRNREDLKRPEIVELKEQLIEKLRRSVSL
ncbi:ABC transporter ATP-binding protein [Anaerotignum lactatifermentans]|uniref:ABC transporter ATP-binding protein n=1 Tax=Anaerotignum lactatifermentans TaxID=160404 RepID=A0ABS2GCX8_9FIRM|nr:ABC transporter ATP-binding protein [Anaerotignum lactatifermentans]MBM6829969.1 ABC transporter ATP-binding protein [Anaerotignum lactatifermentans]MBM6878472.1 ABC transporter ATP-binding protein [Anaerotignum lactatifermentans]MBM6951606.1 ABC transporter ATP-binding protein [Anaerotignum lactatifermentans]